MASEDTEERVLQLCEKYREGITDKIIHNEMPSLKMEEIKDVINKLLLKNKIDLLRKDKTILIKLKDPGTSHRLKGAEPEERLVYKIIEESKIQGIWAREIRAKCNLHLKTVDKVIHRLEVKKLIKNFFSVSAPKKKRYILSSLEPDRALMGGAFYFDQQFDAEFADVLNQQCFRYLEQKANKARQLSGGPIAVQNASYASSKEILNYISELGIAKVQLKLEELEQILETLTFDGKVQKSFAGEGEEGTRLYKMVNTFTATNAFVTIPCGVCPLIKLCADNGNVTPLKCKYMKDWLEF